MRGRNLFIILALVIGISITIVPQSGWGTMMMSNEKDYTMEASKKIESTNKTNVIPERFTLQEGDEESKITGLYHTVEAKGINELDMIIRKLGPLEVPLKDETVITIMDFFMLEDPEDTKYINYINPTDVQYVHDDKGNVVGVVWDGMIISEFKDEWKDRLYTRADVKMALDIDTVTKDGERISLDSKKLKEISKKINKEYSVVVSFRKNNIEWDNVGILHSVEYNSETGNINIHLTAANKDILKMVFKNFSSYIKTYLKEVTKKGKDRNLAFGFKSLPEWENAVN